MENDCVSIASIMDSLSALVVTENRHYLKRDYCEQGPNGARCQVSKLPLQDSFDPMMKSSPSSSSLQDVQDIDLVQSQQSRCSTQSRPESFLHWRQQMIEWATVVIDSFGMDRELVAMSTNLLDRYMAHELSRPHAAPITRDDFQLFSMTCLYLVIKLNEPYPRKLGVDSLVNMSRGFYSAEDVAVTEREILKALEWHVCPPTSQSFVRLLLDIFPQDMLSTRMQSTAMTLTELGMIGGQMIGFKESLVGLASVIYAARMDAVPESVLQEFVNQMAPVLALDQSDEFENVYRSLEQAYTS